MLPQDFTPKILDDPSRPEPANTPGASPTELPQPPEPKPPLSPFPAHPQPPATPPPASDPPPDPLFPQA